MGEDDYNELFGVTPEDGQSQEDGQDQNPAQENVSESDTTEQKGPDVQGTVPDSGTAVLEQEPGQETDAASNSDTSVLGQEPGQGAAIRPSVEQLAQQPLAAQPNDRSGSLAAAQADAQRIIDEAFALSGLKNPYTGQPITSKAEYDAYRERFEAERREQVLKQTGMTQEEFQQFVQELPEVRQTRQAKEEMERAVREAREAAAKVKVDEQLREIATLDPSVKSLEDLAKMPTYPRFYELVQRGNTLTDAFRLANFDTLAQRAAAGARQAAVNSTRSKEHLAETKIRGAGAVSVPAEVREQYKLFNPDATDEEIQKHYQRFHKA